MVLAHNIAQGLRTEDIKISQDVTFDTMLLAPETLRGLYIGGFYKPSPIQLHGIPLGKCGFDMLLEAKSGTGKTAVFSVIALEKLDLSKGLQVVILAPTREIAAQICDVIQVIGSGYNDLCVEVVMGGLPVVADIAKFKNKNKVHIIVASPGRLRHLVQDGYIDISTVRLLVLDEADKLVEKSFQADINYIFSALPKQKQVIMSSATYPQETKEIICQYMKNSQHVCPDSSSVLLGIEQKFSMVDYNSNVVIQTKHKYKELLKILSQRQFKQCLIFCNYHARIDKLHSMLTRDKWPSQQLYGQQEQTDRLGALKTLQEYKCRILIATDLAARGIDASNVDLVINFESPYDWQTYLHRIGRAGRYGSYGIAVTILSEGAEMGKFKKLLNPMRDSLKICHLWNDSDLHYVDIKKTTADIKQANGNELKIPTESVVQKQTSTSQSVDLWKEITSTPNEVKEVVTFEDLYNSFTECSSSSLESFSDLLKSFQNSTLKKQSQNIPYVNLKIDKSLANGISNYLEYMIKKQCYPPNSNSDYQSEDLNKKNIFPHGSNDIENGCISEATHPNVRSCEQTVIETNSKHQSSETFIKCKVNTNDSTRENVETNYEDSDEGTSFTNKEMALLGLPTEFGSKRDSRPKKEAEIKNYQPMKVEYTKENIDCDISSYLYRSAADSIVSSGCRTKKQFYKSGHLQEYATNCKHEHRLKLNTKKAAHAIMNDSESSSSSDQEDSSHTRVNESYTNWYSQIKMRTKQLELAFYIEEMSKI